MNIQKYFQDLELDVQKVYEIAGTARAKGLDPAKKVEVPLARTMAEKCAELIATFYPQMSGCGIDKRILELEKQYGKLDSTVVFKIAEEVAKQKFCKFDSLLQAIDAGVRIGFAYLTLGVVSSPIEGFTELKVEKTRNGKEYFISFDDKKSDSIIGFARLRLPADTKHAFIRELHVYGQAIPLGESGEVQHKGLGKKLLAKAEQIAKDAGRTEVLVLSGVGVKEYYRKLGYEKKDYYMAKFL